MRTMLAHPAERQNRVLAATPHRIGRVSLVVHGLERVVAFVAGAVAARQRAAQRQDALLDEALKETFPASDPVSVVRIT